MSHSAENLGDECVCIAFYNVGIQNKELEKKKWSREDGKRTRLRRDIKAAFRPVDGVQALFLCEFGNMKNTIERAWAEKLFAEILEESELSHLKMIIMPPYVAFINSDVWEVIKDEKHDGLCSEMGNFAMIVVLRQKGSGGQRPDSLGKVVVANCHIPCGKGGTLRRKQDTVLELCRRMSGEDISPCWIIGGDCNLGEELLKQSCQDYVEPGVPCISRSGFTTTSSKDPRKSDLAISRGINLVQKKTWVGVDHRPCASDQHNMVVAYGTFRNLVQRRIQFFSPSTQDIAARQGSDDGATYAGDCVYDEMRSLPPPDGFVLSSVRVRDYGGSSGSFCSQTESQSGGSERCSEEFAQEHTVVGDGSYLAGSDARHATVEEDESQEDDHALQVDPGRSQASACDYLLQELAQQAHDDDNPSALSLLDTLVSSSSELKSLWTMCKSMYTRIEVNGTHKCKPLASR